MWLEYKDIKDKSKWISVSKLTHATNLVSDFHIIYLAKPSLLPLSWSNCYNSFLASIYFQQKYFFLSIFCLFFCYSDLTPVSAYFFFSVCWTFTSILYFFNYSILFLTHIVRYKTTKKTHNSVVITNKTNYSSKRQTIRYNLTSPH